ncbi:MAG: hypothetical protein JSV86_12995 [Gemmatimonadota bacterium]|nr:MAG: hypothetical protein JSV86_12995 [Gemmatimonadota bacterium]
MRDLDNLQTQLAKEEAALGATHEQIEAARQQIEALHAQIAALQSQIAATERQIEELREHAATIEKRMELLREYMSMVDAAQQAPASAQTPPAAAPAPTPTPPDVHHTPVPSRAAAQATGGEGAAEILPSFEEEQEEEIGDLSFVESLPGAKPDDTNPPLTVKPDSFEALDEETLTHELLPRTHTFEEELLLVLAYHRKAIAPKDVGRVFRRLDYAPKQSATEKNIKALVEADHQFFEHAKEGRIALTAEGREEAQRLLEQLA